MPTGWVAAVGQLAALAPAGLLVEHGQTRAAIDGGAAMIGVRRGDLPGRARGSRPG